ncbi:MAG: sigma-70 family RNA polymerase sigma factor [Acidobacteriota bacterium]
MSDELVGLVASAQEGSPEAFRLLVDGCWERLVRLSRSIVGEAEAEDLVQEGLIAAWRAMKSLRNPEGFDAWVARIVFRRCLRRARGFRRFLPMDSIPERSSLGNAEEQLGIWQLLSRLAPRQRAVLHLTIVEGMTDSEIAGSLGIKAASVRAHRRRAKDRLAQLLDGRGL